MSKVSSAIYGNMQGPSSFRAHDKFLDPRAVAAMTFSDAWESVTFRLDDFTNHALDTTNLWVVNKSASATANFAKVAGLGGRITAETSATISQIVTISGDKDYSAANNCGMEVRFQVDAIANFHMEVGFVDASTATNAISVTGIDTPTLANGVVDASVIAMDTGQTTLKTLALIGGNSGASTTTKAALGTAAPAVATWMSLRIQNMNGTILGIVKNASGAEVARASLGAGITAATTLKPWIAFKNLTAADLNPILDYIAVWQDRT